MKYKFLCPRCEQRISADSDVEGTDVNCPVCDFPFVAPPVPPPPPPSLSTEEVEPQAGETYSDEAIDDGTTENTENTEER